MSLWSLYGGGLLETHGPIAAASQAGPSLTTGINTKGAWVQVSAGLAYPSAGIHLVLEQLSTGNQRFAFDVGLGAPGSEVVLLSNLLFFGTAQGPAFLPVAIPSGVPISVRGQSTTSAVTLRAGLWALPEGLGLVGLNRWTTYGMTVSGATAGVAVDAGAVAHTLSAWTELVAATTSPIRALLLLLAGVTESGNTSSFGLVDIGVGAAGSEVPVLSQFQFRLTAAATAGWAIGPFPVGIPTGARLSVRHQSNSTVVASSRNMHWAVLAGG